MVNTVITTKPLEIHSTANSAIFVNAVMTGEQIIVSEEKYMTDPYSINVTGEATFLNPTYTDKEFNAEEWKKSLQYSEEEVKDILKKILHDFELDSTDENIQLVEKIIYNLIEKYEKKYSTKLDIDTRKMLRNLITKMSFDRLCFYRYV